MTTATQTSRLLSLLLVATCLVGAGCVDGRTPPDLVVDPEVVGQWRSDELLPPQTIRMTLNTGQHVDIDQGRTRLALVNTTTRNGGTLIMFGSSPDPWYVQLNGGFGPPFTRDCYALMSVNAYDRGDTVVVRAEVETGRRDFGIRLRKAPGTEPPSRYAPWYGRGASLCLDESGTVTRFIAGEVGE